MYRPIPRRFAAARCPFAGPLVVVATLGAAVFACSGDRPAPGPDQRSSTACSESTPCGPQLDPGTISNIQSLLNSLGHAQSNATAAAQRYVPYLNALVNATVAYNAGVAGGQTDPTTLQNLANAQSSAASAVAAARATWEPVFAEWSGAYNALSGALSAAGIDATLFGYYGITAKLPTAVRYSCSEVYTGDLWTVDSFGPLFFFLEAQGPANSSFCTAI